MRFHDVDMSMCNSRFLARLSSICRHTSEDIADEHADHPQIYCVFVL